MAILLIEMVVIFYISSSLYLFFKQDTFIYYTKHIPKKRPNLTNYKNAKLVTFKTSDNILLSGIKIDNGEYPLVIFYGGNAQDVMNMIPIFEKIKNYNFLFFNYRGYGLSQGKPSKEKILKDSLEIFDYFASKAKSVYLVGRSLGSSVASYVASKRKVEKLILITPFDSIYQIAKDILPFMPIKLILTENFDTKSYIKNIETPIYMLVAKNDKVIPKKNLLNLKKEIKNLKIYKEISGGHNTFSTEEFIEFLEKSFK